MVASSIGMSSSRLFQESSIKLETQEDYTSSRKEQKNQTIFQLNIVFWGEKVTWPRSRNTKGVLSLYQIGGHLEHTRQSLPIHGLP